MCIRDRAGRCPACRRRESDLLLSQGTWEGMLWYWRPQHSGTPVPGHAFPRSLREQQIRLTTPTCRTPPGQSTAIRRAPPKAVLIRLGFDVTYVSNDTSTAIPESGLRTVFLIPT